MSDGSIFGWKLPLEWDTVFMLLSFAVSCERKSALEGIASDESGEASECTLAHKFYCNYTACTPAFDCGERVLSFMEGIYTGIMRINALCRTSRRLLAVMNVLDGGLALRPAIK